MRRVLTVISIILLLLLPVSAFSGISSAQNDTTVSSDGSCQVTLTLQLQLDSIPASLSYPLPEKATDITLNGAEVRAVRSGDTRSVDLTGVIAAPGSHSLTIRYRLNDAIAADEQDQLILTLQLLSGFDYPVDSLSFCVTLPGAVDSRPVFISTYYQDAIETMMTVTREGNTITGTVSTRLQDHETLTMTLPVPAEMFPQPVAKQWSMDTLDLVMIGISLLAIAYWLLTMAGLPPRGGRATTLSDGITAGEIGCRLTGQGVDFTMMVLSWAQMGYLLIQPDDDGRVLLHKRMDMGNERDDFEVRAFRKLFGKRSIVDGTGYYYAQLCRKVSHSKPGVQNLYQRSSGNPLIFRLLAAGAGVVSGISLAAAFTEDSGWRTVLSIVLAIAGGAAAWLMQSAAKSVCSRHRAPALAGLSAAIVWYLLSQAAGEWNVALCLIPAEFLAGLAALYGGRRTETGRIDAREILGLRRYLKTVDPEELRRNIKIDPNYYYNLAPYALALGVDHAFARQMQKTRLQQCPYLTTGLDGHLTAQEWNQLLRDTVHSLDAMQKRLPLDRLLGR